MRNAHAVVLVGLCAATLAMGRPRATEAAPSGFGAALSLDPVTGQQSLIVIGEAPTSGQISIAYDGDALDLQGLRAAPGYQVFGFVDLLLPGSSQVHSVQLYGPGGYLAGQADPRYFEAGTLRVSFFRVPGTDTTGIARAGLLMDQDFGVTGGGGVDLFALDFGTTAYPDPFTPSVLASTYTVFAGPSDYTISPDAQGDDVTLRPPDLVGVRVGGVVPQLPDPGGPASFVAAAALLAGRRRARHPH